MMNRRGRGQSAGLTREQVLTAAQEIVTDEGVGALSMRSLAARLGVTPNALYAHVTGKDDLIDGVLDDVLRGVRRASPDAKDPLAAVARIMSSTYSVLLQHQDLVPVFLARQGSRGPNAVELGRVMDILLERAGVQDVDAARSVLIVHAIGSAAFVTTGADGRRALSGRTARRHFDLGLTWLLEGIAQQPTAQQPTAGRRPAVGSTPKIDQ